MVGGCGISKGHDGMLRSEKVMSDWVDCTKATNLGVVVRSTVCCVPDGGVCDWSPLSCRFEARLEHAMQELRVRKRRVGR